MKLDYNSKVAAMLTESTIELAAMNNEQEGTLLIFGLKGGAHFLIKLSASGDDATYITDEVVTTPQVVHSWRTTVETLLEAHSGTNLLENLLEAHEKSGIGHDFYVRSAIARAKKVIKALRDKEGG